MLSNARLHIERDVPFKLYQNNARPACILVKVNIYLPWVDMYIVVRILDDFQHFQLLGSLLHTPLYGWV